MEAVDPKEDDVSFFFHNNGTVNVESVRLIARTYAPVVAGDTVSQSYDAVRRDFTLIYHICVRCGDTIVFANRQIIYPNGTDFVMQAFRSMFIQGI